MENKTKNKTKKNPKHIMQALVLNFMQCYTTRSVESAASEHIELACDAFYSYTAYGQKIVENQ